MPKRRPLPLCLEEEEEPETDREEMRRRVDRVVERCIKRYCTTPEDEHFQSVQRGRFRREFRNLRLNPTPPIPRAPSRGRSRSRSQNELPLDIDPVRVVFLTEALQRHLNERRATQLSEHLLRSLE
jgi:hypothetical protein